ncbi:asparagine synthase (glutamine-hydrolyzing) [Azospirillum agricola]|uniref:asparagine synthase (glutamine-hydrolyzing) n=1 Tax=Azospirillum agricola TaxID=1720247 RepID=UPI000A0F1F79|nr:asparagine synthase (glutamine-hydrolyzing) [Azospirillum agricola]SMH41572.1 asparagine synthase (glutamine-hydrolysing) [Azospirillum lipoferum]
MCGIAGIVNLRGEPVPGLERMLDVMNRLVAHRGPDGAGTWTSPQKHVGLAHRRLKIIDLTDAGMQPMISSQGNALTYNGEIYNYREIRRTLEPVWNFQSQSDTEVLLAAHDRYGLDALAELRGMFAFALWDEPRQRLFCARDRFGIKPFYYATVGDFFIFASEAKALLPFLASIETDSGALAEYLTFQYTIGEHTLFHGVHQLLPGHYLLVENGRVITQRYWDISYQIDFDHSPQYFQRRLAELIDESLELHLRSDAPIGAHVSGGIDSSLVYLLSDRRSGGAINGFHGRFGAYPGYDESHHARTVVGAAGGKLHETDITAADFRDSISAVMYHLDYPVAGPGAFPQYMLSALAARHVKVVLGGQGGDEIFGGYARYLIAYFEQCFRAAIDGTYRNGNFVVTAESIIPNLGVLREYKPLLQEFWREGLFGGLDDRYFRLIDQAKDMSGEIRWHELDRERVITAFREIFNNQRNVRKEAYLDSMTHFDLKCLIPALLHVEDRMSMAHGLESRVPLLDHRLVEFAATVPADVKFTDGRMKHLLKTTFQDVLPVPIVERRDKMGFPVPLAEWFSGELRDWIGDLFRSEQARNRPFVNVDHIVDGMARTGRFSRKIWGLLSLELWQQSFHDQAARYRAMLNG